MSDLVPRPNAIKPDDIIDPAWSEQLEYLGITIGIDPGMSDNIIHVRSGRAVYDFEVGIVETEGKIVE